MPLNDLYAVIERQAGKHAEFVFTFRGKPVQTASNTAWYAALERAGLDGVRFHDLRHTFASYLVQNGASDRELLELGDGSRCHWCGGTRTCRRRTSRRP